ncbi:dynamin-like GTPase family protein [Helicobacter pylori]
MVLCAQTNFVEFLEQVLEVLKEVEIDKTECSILLESIQKQQLVIPIVGNFSAGKSTLLNRFLEKSVLPTAITPETSLAAELHYSVNERIEAFSNNDEKAESFELNEQSFEAIKNNAAKYSYLKVYLNNEALKNSAPLVFVDMPGFDSPISSHTHAVLEYLERGVHFVILARVEEGALTKRMVRELKNLLEFDKGISFILSKTNLRAPSQAEEVSHYIEEQIKDHLDLTTCLIRSDKDNNALLEVADKIDAEKLFSSLYLKRLKSLNFRLQNSLKSVIESFDYSKEKALEEIQVLDLGVKDIEKTYLINRPNELNSEIESIMQQSLIKNTKLEIEKINLSFSQDFHAEFESLNNMQLSSDFSVNLEHGIELEINALSVILSKNPATRPFVLILKGLKSLLKDLLTLLPILKRSVRIGNHA